MCRAGVACNCVLYAILSSRHYRICDNVRQTLLHKQLCPPGRCCTMQLCPLGHCCILQLCLSGHICGQICMCSCARPVQNHPCSKLNALGRRNTFGIFLQAKVCVMNEMGNVRLLVFGAIIKYVNIHAAYVSSVHARARLQVFCIAPVCICKIVWSGKFCMADTIASAIKGKFSVLRSSNFRWFYGFKW